MAGVPDVSARQAWDALRDDPQAALVDVRTDAEWNFVGLPDLSAAGKQPVLIPGSSTLRCR
jgi:rhodanese-related sulfurtransferase